MDWKAYLKIPSLKNTDKVFWALYLVLCIVSAIALFSASSTLVYKAVARGESYMSPLASHITFLLLGVGAAFVIQFIPSQLIRRASYVLFGLSVLCLALVYTPMGHAENGAGRWLNLFGFRFQPSELAKLSLIVVAADLLSQIKSETDYWHVFLRVLILTLVVCGLIMPSNLSTAVLLAGVVFLMMFLAKIPLKYILSVAGIAILLCFMGYFFVKKVYVDAGVKMEGPMSRAVTWVNRVDRMFEANDVAVEDIAVTDENMQEVYAHIAVANGGKSLIGVLPGNSKERDFLPLAFADYIFAIIVEETGIVGAIILIALYLFVLFRACYASSRYDDYAAMLMVMGLALMITCQALISMCVAVGLGPVTGQPLPLISRGGTSILITSIYFGIMMSVSREQNALANKSESARQESIEDKPIFMDEDPIEMGKEFEEKAVNIEINEIE